MILCSFRHLHLSFGSKVLFKDAELVIHKGDRIGLLGLNGKGKSSLFKILEGEISADQSVPPFTFDKNESYSYFHVPQDMPTEISHQTSVSDIFWYFHQEEKTKLDLLDAINERVAQNKASDKDLKNQEVILSDLEHSNPWGSHQAYLSYCKSLGLEDENLELGTLSGGQKKKCLLALGLSSERELILYDEPTNHLDIDTIRHFEQELLLSSKTFILTTHDRYLLGKTTNKIFQIDRQQITTFNGSYTDFLAEQALKEKERLKILDRLQNSFRREDAWMKQGIKARGTRSKKRVEGFENLKKDIQKIKEGARRELELSLQDSQKKSKVIFEVKNLSFGYSAKDILFHHLNFSIYRGNKVGLVGDNGTGKTTLLKVLSGQLPPLEGEIKKAPELKICFFSQQRKELPLEKSPYEILGEGSDQVSLPDGRVQHVMSYFKSFLFNGDEIHRPLKTFSGGERNRLQLALNLKEDADIWIFDEPTNDLDLETLLILERTLDQFKGSVILISHDRAFLKNTTNRLFLLEEKKIEVFEGGYEQAETYLEAKALEREMREMQWQENEYQNSTKNEPEASSSSPQSNTKSVNQSELTKKIEETESLIDKIDNLMNELGALQSEPETIEKLAQLSQKKLEKEEELLVLYEQLDS